VTSIHLGNKINFTDNPQIPGRENILWKIRERKRHQDKGRAKQMAEGRNTDER
jgi:hypothetical protein